ncbi:hypothetical protein [Microbacterium amylolyticum]|uniref:DUF8094 domain-containing protein n=1 Tax=Microbacterium amylolyticum TaxID=936337 RepID=A0ABS4ZFE4_9MICO|nr:hypothetical protein [Microbacterium amylolyticum]MBP2435753.1 hypothetical protein [Microbacterium amylolyticum]
MRFVWAVVSFLAAVALIGVGAVQLMSLSGPETVTNEIRPADAELPYTVIDAAVLTEHTDADLTVSAEADEDISLSYGRTVDILAWLSDARFNHLTLLDAEDVNEEEGESRVNVSAVEPTETWDGERTTVDPRGSDLWSDEETAEGTIQPRTDLPEGMSVLVATDGEGPAFSLITTTHQHEVTKPWAGPLIALGGLALIVGLGFWIGGFVNLRRRRGPRRKGPKLPATEALSVRANDTAAQADKSAGRSSRSRRRFVVAIPAIALTGALLAGCTPNAWPDMAQDPSPEPTEQLEAGIVEDVVPALTDPQAERIVADIRATLDSADAENDVSLAASRMTADALAMRTVTYELRRDVEDYEETPVSIPDEPVSIVLPQANDGWPRTALVVVSDEESSVPTVLTITQASPWDTYKVTYLARIGPDVEFPALAPRWMGGALVPPDSSFLEVAPQDLAAAYADVMGSGEESEFAELFDLDSDFFLPRLQERRDEVHRELFEPEDGESAEGTAELTFDQRAVSTDPVSLATFDSGAIVAVAVGDSETVRAIHEDAEIMIPRAETQHFVGVESTEIGVTTSYTNELFFFVPAGGSEEKIRLLGYSQSLAGAALLEEPDDSE